MKTDTSKWVSDKNTKRRKKWIDFTNSIKSGWTSTKKKWNKFQSRLVSSSVEEKVQD